MKETEYKYRLTVSRARKVNLGNYESMDVFESFSQGFDNKAELEAVRLELINNVSASINEQIEQIMSFRTADTIPTPKPEPEGQASVSGDNDLWPDELKCRECGQMVSKRPSKYNAEVNPFYYKCGCGKMNYSKGYVRKSKE